MVKYLIYFLFQANLGLEIDSKMHQSHGGSSDDLALQYFSMINKSSTKLLYEMYKMDFLMFNYDPTPYFKISRKDKWLKEKSIMLAICETSMKYKFSNQYSIGSIYKKYVIQKYSYVWLPHI